MPQQPLFFIKQERNNRKEAIRLLSGICDHFVPIKFQHIIYLFFNALGIRTWYRRTVKQNA